MPVSISAQVSKRKRSCVPAQVHLAQRMRKSYCSQSLIAVQTVVKDVAITACKPLSGKHMTICTAHGYQHKMSHVSLHIVGASFTVETKIVFKYEVAGIA